VAIDPADPKRRITLIAALVAGSAVAWWAWPEILPVDTAAALGPPVQVTVTEPARARLRDRYVVSAPLDGQVARLAVRVGTAVEAGQVVARILPSASALDRVDRSGDGASALSRAEREQGDAARAVAAAEAERAKVRADAQRAEVLYAQRLVERARVEEGHSRVISADAALRAALAQREAAEAHVHAARAVLVLHELRGPSRELSLVAPRAGTVVGVAAGEGDTAKAGQTLLEIASPGALEVLADIRTSHALQLAPGTPVRLGTTAGGDDADARVRRVEPGGFSVVDARGQREQRVVVVADVEPLAALRSRLVEGSRTSAQFTIDAGADAVGVPASALFRHGGRWAVFVVISGRARLRHVEPGPVGDRLAAIYAGLSAGERVVVAPPATLRDGLRVRDRR
jgi:HlyD family secretion protein